MTRFASNVISLIPRSDRNRAFMRVAGDGFVALGLMRRSRLGPQGLGLLFALDSSINLGRSVRAVQSRIFTPHLFPWRAISWVYRTDAGNWYDVLVTAWRNEGEPELSRRGASNADLYDLEGFVLRSGYAVTPELSAVIRDVLAEANSAGSLKQREVVGA